MGSKNLKILNIIILSVVVIAAGIFVFRKYFINNKNLTSYLPLETQAYFEYNPHDKNLIGLYENSKRVETRFWQLMMQVGFWGDIKPDLVIPHIKKAGAVILKFEDKWQPAWLLEASDVGQVEALLPVGYFVLPLDKNVFVVTEDQKVIRFFKKQDKEQLIEQSDAQKFIYAKFNNYKFFNAYLSAEYVDYLERQKNEVSYLVLENVNLQENEPLYFGLRSDGAQIVFDLQADEINNSLEYLGQEISKDNFVLMQNMANKNLNLILLQPKLGDLINKLKEKFNFDQDFLENKYNFSWVDFEDLQKYPAVIFLKNKPDRLEAQELLNFENLDWAVLVNIPDSNKREEFYIKIKKFLSSYLAFKYPSWVSSKLADNSEAYILVADADAIEWKTENNTEYFSKDKDNFVLAKDNNGIFLSLNKNLLNLILENIGNGDIINTCPDFKGNELIFLNSQKFIHGLFSYIDRTLIFTQDNGLKGCFMW